MSIGNQMFVQIRAVSIRTNPHVCKIAWIPPQLSTYKREACIRDKDFIFASEALKIRSDETPSFRSRYFLFVDEFVLYPIPVDSGDSK